METLDVRLQKRMHVSLYALLFLTVLLGISILLEGCSDKCETKTHYTYFEPTYITFEELRTAITTSEPRTISSVGKIYRKDSFLFVNDPGKGIHIIDNSDPGNPVVKHFLEIPGNYDLAVKGTTLYADNYVDLVIFDISDVSNIHEVNRVQDVFVNNNYVRDFSTGNESYLITGWVEKEAVEVSQSDCSDTGIQPYIYINEGIAVSDAASFNSAFYKSSAIAPGTGSGPGAGGSMARFAISENYLYTLDYGAIQPFDITNVTSPLSKEKKYIAWDIETIFPYGTNLFIGSASGMHIMDVTQPASPQLTSTYAHVTSCDPVVVDEKYAYVTLRSGTACQGFANQLEVIDIENLSDPVLVTTYTMTNPHGLGIDGSTLFVCDGDDGLKVYNAEDVHSITSNQLAHYANINAFDVIPMNDVLVMIGENGIFQYDYSDPTDIRLLSQIPINAN